MSTAVRTLALFANLSVIVSIMIGLIFLYEGNTASEKILSKQQGTHDPFREFNLMINGYFFQYAGLTNLQSQIVDYFGTENGYYVCSYLRDLVMGSAVYWVTASLWHLVIYKLKGQQLFVSKGRPFPTNETFLDQMLLAQSSLFLYAGLPIISEFLIEKKWTKVYFYLDEIGGWKFYVLYLALYIFCVEFGVYWVHRTLHEQKWMYKYLHGLHHKYNKSTTLTPWCSIAFNPIDGLLQASPYVVFLFVVPVHYFTHVFLLFFSGVWATNIHDSMWGDTEPLMGSKYHTMHHTHYHYNFGQFFTFWDYVYGTLKCPEKTKFD